MSFYEGIEMSKGITLQHQSAEVDTSAEFSDLEKFATLAAEMQRGVNWWIGDIVLAAERNLKPAVREHIWPEWVSPDLLSRCRAVAAAYPPNSRNLLATWSVHMKHANASDRIALVQAAVDAGQTTDENRVRPAQPSAADTRDEMLHVETPAPQPSPPTPAPQPSPPTPELQQIAPANITPVVRDPAKWLLCVDVNGMVAKFFHAGAEHDAASQFVTWLCNLVRRFSEKGLTACVCALDSAQSRRKEMTANWDTPYKSGRSQKNTALVEQLTLVEQLLANRNCDVVSEVGWEADDIMASYAAQYPGRVTLVTADKDMRQCLAADVNILSDVTWEPNPDTGVSMPKYSWITEKSFVTDGINYNGATVKGITPEQWPHFQAIAGDPSDDIRGVEGIGAKGAMDLIVEHKTVQAVIAAAGTSILPAKKKAAIAAFAPFAETMLTLTTLRRDISVPMVSQINLKVQV